MKQSHKALWLTAAGLAAVALTVLGVALYQAWYDRKAPNFSGTRELYL